MQLPGLSSPQTSERLLPLFQPSSSTSVRAKQERHPLAVKRGRGAILRPSQFRTEARGDDFSQG